MQDCQYNSSTLAYGDGVFDDVACEGTSGTVDPGTNNGALASTGMQYFGVTSILLGVVIIVSTYLLQKRKKVQQTSTLQ